jgi:hypothetical protein
MNRMDFRLPGGAKRDSAIDAWLRTQTVKLATIAQEWFRVMRDSGDDVRELMHDGCPVACVEDAPFGYVYVFKAHIDVGFLHGAALPDSGRLLEGSGKYMRHVKLKPGVAGDSAALGSLIDAAYSDIKARFDVG